MGKVSSTTTAYRCKRDCKNITVCEFSCAAAHSCQPFSDEGCRIRRHCCTTRPCRHTDDRKALCASGTILCCRHDPRAFPDAWNYRRYQHRHYEAEKAWHPADLKLG